MAVVTDFDDPFPLRDGQRRAMELMRRLREQRGDEMRDVLRRVAEGRQTQSDVRRLADELGIPLTTVTTDPRSYGP